MAWLGVKEGDRVSKWQAIASLDKRVLQKTLEKYLLDFSKERADFDEDKKVTYADKVLTDTISRILAKNGYDLQKAVLDVELQDLTLKYATLISPIDGVVTHLDAPTAGMNITALTAFTVADPDKLYFEAQVDEVDIGLVKLGQPVQITLDAYPDRPLAAAVDTIEPAGQLDSSGSTVFIIRLNLINFSDQALLLGMNGEAVISVNSKSNILAVPAAAITENGQTQVQILENNRPKTQTVTVGISNNDLTEITSGLAAGQTVIVSKKH